MGPGMRHKSVNLQSELRLAALLMRFHTAKPEIGAKTYATYATIAKVLGLTIGSVQHICRQHLREITQPRWQRDPSRVLDEHHVEWLTKEENLILHSGKSLAERAALFTQKFQDKRIAVTTLRRLYL